MDSNNLHKLKTGWLLLLTLAIGFMLAVLVGCDTCNLDAPCPGPPELTATSEVGQGDSYMSSQNYDQAIALYTAAVTDDPSDQAYYKRGMAYKAKGDRAASIADFTEAIYLGGSLSDWTKLAKDGLTALGVNPDTIPTATYYPITVITDYFAEADAAMQKGDYVEAANLYDSAAIYGPPERRAEAYYKTGMADKAVGDSSDAIYHFQKAIAAATPGDPWAAKAQYELNALGVTPTP